MRNEQLQKDCKLPYASHGHAAQVVAALQAAGAAAVLIHGRTQEQRYNKAANWDVISRVAGAASVPIIGNGDVLTLFEVMCRTSSSLHFDRVHKVFVAQ